MSSIFDVLGIDADDLEWFDLGLCQGMPHDDFYEKYESDAVHAKTINELCASCPVRKECLLTGVQNSEYGVWGGWYLTAGKIDEARNQHKDEATKKKLKEF